jgi:hypothetical protein
MNRDGVRIVSDNIFHEITPLPYFAYITGNSPPHFVEMVDDHRQFIFSLARPLQHEGVIVADRIIVPEEQRQSEKMSPDGHVEGAGNDPG